MKSTIKTIVPLVCLLTCLAICTLSIHYFTDTARPAFYPHGFAPSSNAWAEAVTPFEFGSNGKIYYHSRFTSSVMVPPATPQTPRVIEFSKNIPTSQDASLFVAFEKVLSPPPSLTIFANDRRVASIAYGDQDGGSNLNFAEIRIPASSNNQELGSLRIVSESGSWCGGILLMPYAQIRLFLSWLLFPSLITGVFLSFWLFTKRAWLLFISIGILAFSFYYSWNFQLKIMPLEAFFADSKEIVDIIRFNTWDFDMQKHVLFLPAIRIVAAIASLFSSRPLQILSMAFSLIAAANLVLAAASIRLCGFKRSYSGLLTALYGGSFSILTYSSIFETYIFSSLIMNALLFASLKLAISPTKRISQIAAVLCGFLPLATWQLAAFMPAFLFWHAIALFKQKSSCRAVLNHSAIAVAAFAIGYGIVWSLYAGPLAEAVDSTTNVLNRTADAYGRIENMNADTFRTVLLDTFVTSLINTEQPAVVAASLRSSFWMRCAAIGFSLLFCLGGVLSIFTLRGSRMSIALMGAFCFAAYIGFHWWFNPVEMLLYTPPVLLLWLLPLTVLLKRTRAGAHLVLPILLALLMLQLVCITLASRPFRGCMPTAEQVQGKCKTIRWSVR